MILVVVVAGLEEEEVENITNKGSIKLMIGLLTHTTFDDSKLSSVKHLMLTNIKLAFARENSSDQSHICNLGLVSGHFKTHYLLVNACFGWCGSIFTQRGKRIN